MSRWGFAKRTLFEAASPACFWRHPRQAARLVGGASGNALLAGVERLVPGGPHDCPVCGWRGRQFRTFLSADEIIPRCICPGCGAFDRHRLLALALRRELARPGRREGALLAFAQSSCVHDFLAREGAGRCFRADFVRHGPFAVEFVTDLRAVGVATASIGTLFCSHVLEHIPVLEPCLDEIARLLRPGGVAWIQVPQEPGLARSRSIPVEPRRAHAHAWQFGNDFGDLLRRPAWTVEEFAATDLATPAQARRCGIAGDERCWRLTRR
ncbi:MAG: methyltransferase domain-containing protein [Candidatus Krumholzibacteriia bacterium]